jgi:hypothetical protein
VATACAVVPAAVHGMPSRADADPHRLARPGARLTLLPVGVARSGGWRLTVCLLTLTLGSAPAWAFDLEGHTVLEAAAYRRLLALERVPGTEVSGRTLLAALITAGILARPPCFDHEHRRVACTAGDRAETPLAFWPVLRAGAADLVIDRQLSARAQCQHFMAETSDGLAPPDPRLGVPAALATTAYTRCIRVLGATFDGILRAPGLAQHRLVGIYSLIHALQDSFSPAHTERDERNRILLLRSWTLLDVGRTLWRGQLDFPASTHHAITDPRDGRYMEPAAITADGRRCGDIHNGYAMPETCLTPLGRAAVDAVVDLLVLTYRLRARAAAAGREPSLAAPEDAADWEAFMSQHLASAVAPVEPPPPGQQIGFKRPDTFLGVQGSTGHGGSGVGPWAAHFFYGPAVPFALVLSAGIAFNRQDGASGLTAATGLGLVLPLVRRFAIGAAPALIAGRCDTSFERCAVGLFATVGEIVIPLSTSTWLGVQGPRWSWDDRALRGPVVGLAFGWSDEQRLGPPRSTPAPASTLTWDPPRPEEVRAYRGRRATWLLFLASTAASTAQNQWVGGGLEIRRDIDRWGRATGWSPALSLALTHGTIEGSRGEDLVIAPSVSFALIADRLALSGAPALVRVGTMAGHAVTADVAGLLALALKVGRLEIAVTSPPLSYLSSARRHWLPISFRLGFLIE